MDKSTETQSHDYLSVSLWKDKKDNKSGEVICKGVDFQIRWSAQKPLIEKIMASKVFDSEVGIDEVRATIRSALVIKAQAKAITILGSWRKESEDKRPMHQYIDELTPTLQQKLNGEMIDWVYEAKAASLTDEEKATREAKKNLKKLQGMGKSKAELLAMIEAMGD